MAEKLDKKAAVKTAGKLDKKTASKIPTNKHINAVTTTDKMSKAEIKKATNIILFLEIVLHNFQDTNFIFTLIDF